MFLPQCEYSFSPGESSLNSYHWTSCDPQVFTCVRIFPCIVRFWIYSPKPSSDPPIWLIAGHHYSIACQGVANFIVWIYVQWLQEQVSNSSPEVKVNLNPFATLCFSECCSDGCNCCWKGEWDLTEPMTSFRTTYNSTYNAAVHGKTGRSNVERSAKSVQSSFETSLGKRGEIE